MIRLIQPPEVDHVWGAVAERVETACRKARSNMTAAEIYKACRVGVWFLVIVTDHEKIIGTVVFDITAHPDGNTMKVIILSGDDARAWFPDMIKGWDWLDTMGVKRVVGEGRPGKARLFKDDLPGVRVVSEIYEWIRHAD